MSFTLYAASAGEGVSNHNFYFLAPSMREARRGADERSLVGVSRLADMRYMSFHLQNFAKFYNSG